MSFIILRHIDKITGKKYMEITSMCTECYDFGYFFFHYTYPVISKISAMNTYFLNVKQGNMSFFKKKNKELCQGSYVSEEQSDEVTSGHMKAHVHEHSYIH